MTTLQENSDIHTFLITNKSPISRKLLKLTKLKAQGNDYYKNQNYKEALSFYEKVLYLVSFDLTLKKFSNCELAFRLSK